MTVNHGSMRDSDLLDAFNLEACSRTCQWWSNCFLIPKSWTSTVSIRWTHNWMCLFYQQQGINNSNHLSLSRVDRCLLILVCKFQLYGFTPYCSKSRLLCQLFFVDTLLKNVFDFSPFIYFLCSFVVSTFNTGPNPTFSPTKNVWKKNMICYYHLTTCAIVNPRTCKKTSINKKITTTHFYVCFDHKPL